MLGHRKSPNAGFVLQEYEHYYKREIILNEIFNNFAMNYAQLYGGENSVRKQIGFPNDNGKLLHCESDHWKKDKCHQTNELI